jgi:hypothetical protein
VDRANVYAPNKGIVVTVFLKNVGPGIANAVSIWAMIGKDAISRETEEGLFQKLHSDEARASQKKEQDVANGDEIYFSIRSPPLSEQEWDSVRNGDTALYFAALVTHQDLAGKRFTEWCMFFFGNDPSGFHYCSSHNVLNRKR